MDTLCCDTIGCTKAGAWVRSKDLDPNHNDFLCNPCWAILRILDPQEAAGYIPWNTGQANSIPPEYQEEAFLILIE